VVGAAQIRVLLTFLLLLFSACLMYNQGTMKVYTVWNSHTNLERTSGDIYWTRNVYETCVTRLPSQFGPIAAYLCCLEL